MEIAGVHRHKIDMVGVALDVKLNIRKRADRRRRKDGDGKTQYKVHNTRLGWRRNLINKNAIGCLLRLRRHAQDEAYHLAGSGSDPGKRRTQQHHVRGSQLDIAVVTLLTPGVGAYLNSGFSSSFVGYG